MTGGGRVVRRRRNWTTIVVDRPQAGVPVEVSGRQAADWAKLHGSHWSQTHNGGDACASDPTAPTPRRRARRRGRR